MLALILSRFYSLWRATQPRPVVSRQIISMRECVLPVRFALITSRLLAVSGIKLVIKNYSTNVTVFISGGCRKLMKVVVDVSAAAYK